MSNSASIGKEFRRSLAARAYVLCVCALLMIMTLVAACSKDETTVAPTALGTLVQTLQIGTYDAEADEPYMFGFISEIAADSAGRIYVSDGLAQEIRVFDRDGIYVRSFGERGEGPGEFQRITAMLVDSNNHLVVADAGNARISVFDCDGTLLRSHISPIANPVSQISELPNGQFLFVGLHHNHLAHIVDADFEKVLAHLVPASEIMYTEEQLEEMWFQMAPGYGAALSDDKIVFAPAFYGGHLYIYRREEDNTWSLASVIDAYPIDGPPLAITDGDDAAAFHASIPTSDGGFVVGSFHFRAATRGLYGLNDGGALYVFSHETESGITFLAGIVTSDATYEGHYVARESGPGNHLSAQTFEVDANNNIYMAEDHEYPTLRRLRIPSEG